MYVDKSRTYVGIVEENQDPKKLGRCRVRVIDIFDEIPVEDIPWASPWKDLNGNSFNVPEKGKIVTIVFDSGNIYKPEYVYADHFNINLEKKLQSLEGKNYTSMKSLIFDHKTQIYSNDEEGLKFDYKFNNINITKDEININLKDNFAKVNIGTPTSNQQAILGNHFLNWFDEFIDNLLGNQGGPFLGNLGAAVVPNPGFITICQKYQALKDPKFLSHHINLVDNEYVQKQDRINDSQTGDAWKSTVKVNELTTKELVDYTPQDGNSTDSPVPSSGDLTTSSDPNGVQNSENIATDPGPIQSTNNPDVNSILATMRSKGYTILTKPYQMNIIGIRRQYEGMKYSNAFIDDLYLLFKVDQTDKWEIKKYKISTMPGFFKAVEVQTSGGKKLRRAGYKLKGGESFVGNTTNGESINVKTTSIMQGRGGIGILKNAQYIDIYEIGEHGGDPALVTNGRKQKAYRDNTPVDTIKYSSENEGNFAMYIHRGYSGGRTVDNWSEGCQVFSSQSELKDFFKWLNMHKDKHGNRFNYTLMLERDLVSGS
jgi:hypothetical protein